MPEIRFIAVILHFVHATLNTENNMIARFKGALTRCITLKAFWRNIKGKFLTPVDFREIVRLLHTSIVSIKKDFDVESG